MKFDVKAGTTPRYTATLLDENETVIPASLLTTLTLTLFNIRTNAVVNGRDRQDIKNAHNVTVSELGVVIWSIQVADLPATSEADYLAIFEWTWSTGTKSGWHDMTLHLDPLPRPA